MDTSGIEVLSVKGLESNPGLGLVNRGYLPHDDASSKDKADGTNTSGDGMASVHIGGGGGGGEAHYAKRDSSSVDFTLPEKNAVNKAVRDRSKSIGGDDNYHYKERSKSISDGPYRGMGKEELLRYSSRPLWRNLRYACMSIVLTGWLALLITVVALVLTYPSCRDAQRKDWWQKTVIYRIYVRSYHDSGRDGTGDLEGIRRKLDYLKETGVDTISLSPIYKLASGAETDTHIVNHTEIDGLFGNMDDFRSLVNETHQKGMHIILDFIPNHTSDKHPWFLESQREVNSRENPYRSYYVWAKGQSANEVEKPNNWKSVYDNPAWTLNTGPNYYYLHQFLSSQPDLNLRSEKVRVELEEILQFWLDEGVDGFYIRDSDFLFEDYDLRDDILLDNNIKPGCPASSSDDTAYDCYRHDYTRGLNEVFDMLARWRAFLDDRGNETGKYKILVADVEGSYPHVMDFYGLFNRDGVDFPLNHFGLKLTSSDSGQDVTTMVNTWMSQMPQGRWANWMGGDDRSPRLADRLGEKMAMPYLMLTMLMPGTPYLYYGDEIGMLGSPSNDSDPWSRDKPMRGPMLWSGEHLADFCDGCVDPWMALHPAYGDHMNVKYQKADPYSMWNLFKNLTTLRKSSPSFEYGDYVPSIQDHEIFSFVREFDGERGYLVALNFVNRTVKKYLTGTHDTIPGGASIEVISGRTSRQSGDGLGLDPVTLDPYQGVVVSWEYEAEDL